MRGAIRGGEGDGRTIPIGFDGCQGNVGDAIETEAETQLLLGHLRRRRPRRSAAQQGRIEAAREIGVREPRAVGRRDAAIDDAVGQADEIAGEPMPAEVGALPGPLGMVGGQGGHEHATAERAAGVALAVRADEEDRVGHRRPELGDRLIGEASIASSDGWPMVRTAISPLSVSTRMARRTASASGIALAAPDEERAHAARLGVAREVLAEHVLDGIGAPGAAILDQHPATRGGRRVPIIGSPSCSASAEQRIGASSVIRPGPGSRAAYRTGEKRTGQEPDERADGRHPERRPAGR